jgi:peptidyl-prolyl cis-trans isomerase SurA
MNGLKSRIALGLAVCLASSVAAPQTRELGSTGELLDGIAAVVENGVVLKSEVQSRLALVLNNFRQQQAQLPAAQRSQLPPLSVLERQVLDQLVLEEIQVQRADRLGIVIGDDLLNQLLATVAQNLNISLEQLPEALAAQHIDYATYREDQRKELMIGQLEQRDVTSRISVAPRELQQCLARLEATQTNEFDYNVSHILIGFAPSASQSEVADAQARAERIVEQLDEGADFAQLALTYSESQTALQGGALGWRKGSELPSMFADEVTRLEPGEHSQPIRTTGGFQIVKLNDMRGAERVVVDQVHLRHILLRPTEILDDDATLQKLIGIRNQLEAGEDFGAIASAVSDDPSSATDGGDLGWVELGADPPEFAPEFEEELAKLKVNELSQPFHTRYGWHLAEITGKRTHDTTDELKQQRCQREIRASKAEEERDLWLRQLRDEAFVDYRL